MKISERIAKLIDVKSIITICSTIVFSLMALNGTITSEQFLTIFTVIIGFYFGTQNGKNQSQSAIDNLTSKQVQPIINNNFPASSIPFTEGGANVNEPMPYTSIDKNIRDGIL